MNLTHSPHTGQHLQGCISCYKFNDLQVQIEAAAEVYKSGQTNSKKALAEVKRLIKRKVLSMELARSLATAAISNNSCEHDEHLLS